KEPRPDPWRRTSGIHGVSSQRGLGVVRELWLERDRIARERDLSPGRVLQDSAIVEAALAMPRTPQELTAIKTFTVRLARRYVPVWLKAINRVRGLKAADRRCRTGQARAPPWVARDPHVPGRPAPPLCPGVAQSHQPGAGHEPGGAAPAESARLRAPAHEPVGRPGSSRGAAARGGAFRGR